MSEDGPCHRKFLKLFGPELNGTKGLDEAIEAVDTMTIEISQEPNEVKMRAVETLVRLKKEIKERMES